MTNRFLSERLINKAHLPSPSHSQIGNYTSTLSVLLFDRLQPNAHVAVSSASHTQFSVTAAICAVVISVGQFFLNIPVKKATSRARRSSLLQVPPFPALSR